MSKRLKVLLVIWALGFAAMTIYAPVQRRTYDSPIAPLRGRSVRTAAPRRYYAWVTEGYRLIWRIGTGRKYQRLDSYRLTAQLVVWTVLGGVVFLLLRRPG